MHRIEIDLQERILVLDGAMGTMIQAFDLTEQDFRNQQLADHVQALKGNNDLLNISRPDIIQAIHRQYLGAGADIVTTNTFNGNHISQNDYYTAQWVYDINYYGAKIAREAVDEILKKDPSRPRYVAGAMGPTTRLASISPDVNNPAYRSVSFDQLVNAFREQARALVDGGVDLFLLETITDTLNAKAALFALMELFDKINRQLPIMVSGTITDASGRILSGQTLEAFLISISHAPLLSVGLNCALGAYELRPYVQVLSKECPFYVSAHPNAGLPNEFGGYDQTPEEIATILSEFAQEGWLNIVGGCCGTTPKHIEAIAKSVAAYKPRKLPHKAAVANNETKIEQDTPKLKFKTSSGFSTAPTYTLHELLDLISYVEDESTFYSIKAIVEKEKDRYHSEQLMLVQAHLFGRFQYLQAAGKLAKVVRNI